MLTSYGLCITETSELLKLSHLYVRAGIPGVASAVPSEHPPT